jgi:putative transcriptional regulator
MESRLDIHFHPRYSEKESQLYMPPSISNRVANRVANRVKDLRTARGWTQEQLAQAVGVSRQSINSIERNRYVPSLELALIFAHIFACPTDQIFQLESPE